MSPRHRIDEHTLQVALLMGPTNGCDLAQRLHSQTGSKISQPTMSRKLAQLVCQGKVLQLGERRGRLNFWLRPLQGVSNWPVYQVFEDSHVEQVGQIWRVYPGFAWTVGGEIGHSESLPWWLIDLLPQGYIGRMMSIRYGVTIEAGQWSEDDTLRHLEKLDLSGDLVIGDVPYLAFVNKDRMVPSIAMANLASIAQDPTLHSSEGVSIGGEQPKFIRYVTGLGECLIKFSPSIDSGSNAQRWADLLVAEAIAMAVLQEHGMMTAETYLHITPERHYLLSRRFDRLSNFGRRGVVSLKCLNAEFLGWPESTPWPKLARGLVELDIISPDALAQIELLWAFGALIANTDMHTGNLSFLRTAKLSSIFRRQPPLNLAPAYDMLPMAYAPDRGGNMRSAETLYVPQLTTTVSVAVWQQASAMAECFWMRLLTAPALSNAFRVIADEMLSQQQTHLRASLGRMG